MPDKLTREQAERLADELLAKEPRWIDGKLVKTLTAIADEYPVQPVRHESWSSDPTSPLYHMYILNDNR
ncbi:hypothetical protein KY495_17525 [Massilia sp. PAMC28688]|uniref:hypothetical protein n=1 Tax=Massilia sp. PAMC28688 TaxID=2861283 RepID=UPI001C625467|nr:hypothetical protein [Massilia sp. PAMC28688]QYF92529.1 hypothetical protein KY495_17525 [Massilia sp. PAMC28688]